MRTTLTVVLTLLAAILAAAFILLRTEDALMVAFGTLVAAGFAVLPVLMGVISRRRATPPDPRDAIVIGPERRGDIGPPPRE